LSVAVVLALVSVAGVLLAPTVAPAAGGPPSQGAAVSWGSNYRGQLGDGTTCDDAHPENCNRTRPVPVVGVKRSPFLVGAVALSAGTEHSLALLEGGRVRAWGGNDHGQLGDGTAVPERDRPVVVLGPDGTGQLTGVKSVAAGNVHSLALARDGTVWAWGHNIWGQLGAGIIDGPDFCPIPPEPPHASDSVCSKRPVAVIGPGGAARLTHVTAVAAGVNHSVALRADGTVWTWGQNGLGQLGIGDTKGPEICAPYMPEYGPSPCSAEPVPVVGPDGTGRLDHVVAVAAGDDYSLAVRVDGTVWAWGSNAYAGLGQPESWEPEVCVTPYAPIPTACSTRPIPVIGPDGETPLRGVKAVAANGSPMGLHVLALRRDGTVWAWGIDDMGQLGDGVSQTQSRLPVQVVGPRGEGHLTHVERIAAGGKFSLARRVDGSLWAWGLNNSGQLGIGIGRGPNACTVTLEPCSLAPVRVLGPVGTGVLADVTAFAAGQRHGLALEATQRHHRHRRAGDTAR
jgi:alpha-tubulin suppressor-like RCC1 family protein